MLLAITVGSCGGSGGGSGGGIGALGGGDAPLSGGTELATLSQPEPASLLLLGGGLMVMSYFTKNRKKK